MYIWLVKYTETKQIWVDWFHPVLKILCLKVIKQHISLTQLFIHKLIKFL